MILSFRPDGWSCGGLEPSTGWLERPLTLGAVTALDPAGGRAVNHWHALLQQGRSTSFASSGWPIARIVTPTATWVAAFEPGANVVDHAGVEHRQVLRGDISKVRRRSCPCRRPGRCAPCVAEIAEADDAGQLAVQRLRKLGLPASFAQRQMRRHDALVQREDQYPRGFRRRGQPVSCAARAAHRDAAPAAGLDVDRGIAQAGARQQLEPRQPPVTDAGNAVRFRIATTTSNSSSRRTRSSSSRAGVPKTSSSICGRRDCQSARPSATRW